MLTFGLDVVRSLNVQDTEDDGDDDDDDGDDDDDDDDDDEDDDAKDVGVRRTQDRGTRRDLVVTGVPNMIWKDKFLKECNRCDPKLVW